MYADVRTFRWLIVMTGTGQEESYVWGRYFGSIAPGSAVVKQQQHPEDDKATSGTQAVVTKGAAAADALANLTLAAILAYLPSVPHWAYNGGCPSWGDLSNNAKWSGILLKFVPVCRFRFLLFCCFGKKMSELYGGTQFLPSLSDDAFQCILLAYAMSHTV